jgi:AraC-like DNA-binding protein
MNCQRCPMPSLPVPLFVSLVLAAFVLRGLWLRDRPMLFVALMAACAVQGAIIALVQHYGVQALRPVQPVTAALIPPLAWVVFAGTARRAPGLADLWGLLVPAFVGFCVSVAPQAVDPVLMAVFIGYGAAMLWVLRQGADALPRLALVSGNIPLRLWQGVALALVGSGLSDGLIVLAQVAGRPDWQPWIITLASSGTLLLVGLFAQGAPEAPAESAAGVPADPTPQDAEIVARLTDLMVRERLYLDPDLTLARLSRRLRVPLKPLSAAVNRATGENVSRYINGFRIKAACDLLDAGKPVTEAMLSSGFNTKSNFNREFRRVTAKAPSDWRAGDGQAQETGCAQRGFLV